MALGWRQVVDNLEIKYMIFMGYLHSYITRPDTRQYSRGRLGRSRNAKTARNLTIFRTDLPTYRPTRQGVESRVRD